MRDREQTKHKSNQNVWLIYNVKKRKLTALNLSPEEYEIRIKELIKELQI